MVLGQSLCLLAQPVVFIFVREVTLVDGGVVLGAFCLPYAIYVTFFMCFIQIMSILPLSLPNCEVSACDQWFDYFVFIFNSWFIVLELIGAFVIVGGFCVPQPLSWVLLPRLIRSFQSVLLDVRASLWMVPFGMLDFVNRSPVPSLGSVCFIDT